MFTLVYLNIIHTNIKMPLHWKKVIIYRCWMNICMQESFCRYWFRADIYVQIFTESPIRVLGLSHEVPNQERIR